MIVLAEINIIYSRNLACISMFVMNTNIGLVDYRRKTRRKVRKKKKKAGEKSGGERREKTQSTSFMFVFISHVVRKKNYSYDHYFCYRIYVNIIHCCKIAKYQDLLYCMYSLHLILYFVFYEKYKF